MLVRDVMTRSVVTVAPGAPVREAAAVLAERGFTALPVVDGDGDLVGVVTEADLLRDRVLHDVRTAAGEELAVRAPQRVAEVMTAAVFTTDPMADVADLVERMRALGIRSVPVVTTRDGVVGIVSRRDVLRTVARTDAAIAADVRRRLDTYAGPGRWDVEVDGGRVTLRDPFGDPDEEHPASVVAASVPGVQHVRVLPVPD